MKIGLEKIKLSVNAFDIDLSKYEKMYDTFDSGHDRTHMEFVRKNALMLGDIYAKDKLKVLYIAATLHDIGLSVSRDNHEMYGARIVASDKYLKSVLTKEELIEVMDAIKEHRASSGDPKFITSKIISDADRFPVSISYSIYRSIAHNINEYPNKLLEFYLTNAGLHITKKFKKGSYGRRCYFKETEVASAKIYDTIITTYRISGTDGLWKLVDTEHKNKINALMK